MCGGGGGSGQRALESEEKDLLRMQTAAAQQGLQGRNEAMGSYRDFARRGREMGSLANQERAAGRVQEDAMSSFGNMNRMADANMASMGVNAGDARFMRGRDTAGVRMAGQVGVGMDAARRGARQEGLQLEGAGAAGLAGFDPSGALNGMASTIGNAQRTGMMADAASAQGWGQLGQAGMYGLANADKVSKGWDTVKGWFPSGGGGSSAAYSNPDGPFADGGYVPHYAEGGVVRRYAQGGNVYDQAQQDMGGAYRSPSQSQVAPPQQGPAVDPVTAMKAAKFAVDKVSASSLGYGAATPGVSMGGEQAAMLADQTGAFGAEGLKMTADAAAYGMQGAGTGAALGAETAAAGAAGAEAAGAAGAAAAGETALASGLAGASTVLGTAIPVLGVGLLAAKAMDLFADGGSVRPGIDRQQRGGRAENENGGRVSGPGGPKDDMVLARLSPGEFVMPVGAVRKFGLDRLEKMRQAGLEFEQQNNIH